MGKVTEHQDAFLSKLRKLLSDYEGVTCVNSVKSKYLSIKRNNKVILTIYFRANETRFYVNDNSEMLALYEKFLKDGKVYQHDTADENKEKGKYAFYADEKDEMLVVKGYLDIA